MLDEEVHQWYKGRKESSTKDLPPVYSLWVWWTESETTDRPRESRDQVRDHEDVVPVMIVGRGDIGPASAGKSSEDSDTSDEFGQNAIRSCGKNIP